MSPREDRLAISETVAAVALLAAFFLPWFHNPSFSVNGWNAGRFFLFFTDIHPVAPLLRLCAWLIAPGALLVMLLGLLRKPSGAACLITGMLPWILMIVLLFRGVYIIPQLGIGMILTLPAALALIILGAVQKG